MAAALTCAGCASATETGSPEPGSTATPATTVASTVATTIPPTSRIPAPTTRITTAGSTTAGVSGQLQLIIEPDQGIGPIDAVLASPQHRLDMTMYELVDTTAEQILASDAARGVTVRVVLDHNREASANAAAYQYLNAHGAKAVWAPSAYEATHEKAAVIDAGYADASALIMTLNLTSRYYATTRDFAVVDRQPADVAAVESVFSADFAGQSSTTTSPGADLVWSPGSQSPLVALIGSARHDVTAENEEMSNSKIVDAFEGTARAGVGTQVTMTAASDYQRELSSLVAAGAGVHTFPDTSSALYIHAKVIITDAGTPSARAFVGSENFSSASLDDNRELGLVISDPTIVAELAATLARDYADAPAFSG